MTAELIAHLAELDTRDVHLREGYPSLFVYCRDVLGLSDGEAYNRIEVARAARRFPVILELLAEGSVNLTTVRLLAPHLTPDNHREVLASSRGKRKAGRRRDGRPAGAAARRAVLCPARSDPPVRAPSRPPMRWAARLRSTASSCGVGDTTITRAACIPASAGPRANSFLNKFA